MSELQIAGLVFLGMFIWTIVAAALAYFGGRYVSDSGSDDDVMLAVGFGAFLWPLWMALSPVVIALLVASWAAEKGREADRAFWQSRKAFADNWGDATEQDASERAIRALEALDAAEKRLAEARDIVSETLALVREPGENGFPTEEDFVAWQRSVNYWERRAAEWLGKGE